ncbi:hypothetical protein V501_01777 [Pseudogymnoascus sp. VKM F-4519 (FW-2642)]|nr:hypothetical protein V501_01777 [Pseudogymnoascus sp. VKM F-4519 (FW-2642)]
MPPNDHPPQSQAHYIPPPQQLPQQPLSPEQYGYDMYDQNGEGTQTLYAAEYTVVSRAQTKRTQRTSQACKACRDAKARCTDSKPCQGCVEKDINCIYDPPPPKHRLEDKIDHLLKRQESLEKALITLHPGVSTILEQSDEVIGGWKEKYKDEDFDSSVREGEMADSDDGSESQVSGSVPPGEPAIPIGHTTGAAKILQWPVVVAMVGEKMKKDGYKGIDPLRREIRRDIINLYRIGEGVQRSVGCEKDSISDHSSDPSISSSETYSDTTYSSSLKQQFSLSGGQSTVAESYFFMADTDARTAADLTTLPQLDERTVSRLESRRKRDRHRTSRLSIADNAAHPYAQHLNLGRRQRTISEAIVLLILALGKVCEHQAKIPDVVPDNNISTSNSPSNPFSPPLMHRSPQMSSHSSAIPSPIMQDGAHHRRSFTDASGNRYPTFTRNGDVIPGLAYFAIATDILGSHAGDMGLPYVHTCFLASLYQNQLGRVLQSHVYVKEAGYALTIMLKQHLPRYKQMQEDLGNPDKQKDVKWPPKDNRILFTFWTCLQLESDIVAELEVPQSGILSLELIMPWPNLAMALDNNEMSEMEMRCYLVQLLLRKKLNIIHRELYGPGKENGYQLADMNKLPYIDTMIEDLNGVRDASKTLAWRDGDPPATNILEARLRAKMYGAQVITCRPFLRMVLNSQYEGTGDVAISEPIMEYARKCIRAMFYSVQAFWGIKGGRLVVANVWGTSHAAAAPYSDAAYASKTSIT